MHLTTNSIVSVFHSCYHYLLISRAKTNPRQSCIIIIITTATRWSLRSSSSLAAAVAATRNLGSCSTRRPILHVGERLTGLEES